MNEVLSFKVSLLYNQVEDKFEMTNDRPLTKADVVLMISNLLSLLPEEERTFASKIAIDAVKASQQAIESQTALQ